MLDRGDGDAGGVADYGVQAGVDHAVARGRHAVLAGQVGPDEDHAAVLWRRPDRHPNVRTRMQAHAGKDRRSGQGVLMVRRHRPDRPCSWLTLKLEMQV